MDHEERAPDAAGAERPGAQAAGRGDADDVGARLLEEQQARIAALRAAVLAGQVPEDEAAFDYARFFGGPAKGEGAAEG